MRLPLLQADGAGAGIVRGADGRGSTDQDTYGPGAVLKHPSTRNQSTLLADVPLVTTGQRLENTLGLIASTNRLSPAALDSFVIPENKHLDLDFFFLESRVEQPSASALGLAERLLRGRSLAVKSCSLNDYNTVRDEGVLKDQEYCRSILACCIELGLEQMQKLWRALDSSFVKNDSFGTGPTSKLVLRPIAEQLVRAFGVEKSDAAKFTRVSNAISDLLTLLVDQQVRHLLQTVGTIQVNNTGDKAFTFRKGGALLNNFRLAVPVALADPSYMPLSRVWILEPADPTGRWPLRADRYQLSHWDSWKRHYRQNNAVMVMLILLLARPPQSNPWDIGFEKTVQEIWGKPAWRLCGKTTLFGSPTLVPDGRNVSLMDRQRVYGAPDFYDPACWGERSDTTMQGVVN